MTKLSTNTVNYELWLATCNDLKIYYSQPSKTDAKQIKTIDRLYCRINFLKNFVERLENKQFDNNFDKELIIASVLNQPLIDKIYTATDLAEIGIDSKEKQSIHYSYNQQRKIFFNFIEQAKQLSSLPNNADNFKNNKELQDYVLKFVAEIKLEIKRDTLNDLIKLDAPLKYFSTQRNAQANNFFNKIDNNLKPMTQKNSYQKELQVLKNKYQELEKKYNENVKFISEFAENKSKRLHLLNIKKKVYENKKLYIEQLSAKKVALSSGFTYRHCKKIQNKELPFSSLILKLAGKQVYLYIESIKSKIAAMQDKLTKGEIKNKQLYNNILADENVISNLFNEVTSKTHQNNQLSTNMHNLSKKIANLNCEINKLTKDSTMPMQPASQPASRLK